MRAIVNRVTRTATSTNEYCIMVDLINSNDSKECMTTLFEEEDIALLEFVKKL